MWDLWGVTPGSVTPFGAINDHEREVNIVLDADLMDHAVLNFHPLINTRTTTIRREDLLLFLRHCQHEPLIVKLPSPASD